MPAIAAMRGHGDISGYRAFVPKMASKNMMNHYRSTAGGDSISRCYRRNYVQNRTSRRSLR
jgi:hypothetical protein